MRTHFFALSGLTLLILAGCRKDSANIAQPVPVSSPASSGDGSSGSSSGDSTDLPPAEPSFITYLIPAGQNFCVGNRYAVDTFWGVSFQAIFDSSCIYTTANPVNQADINKLYGFSDSSSHHHQNSARFGWNWEAGALHIYGYSYRSGVRQSTEICTVSLHEPHSFSIETRPGQYFFSVDNKYFALMERAAQEPYAHGYSLLPYFGGDEPAPHDIRIKIKEISRR